MIDWKKPNNFLKNLLSWMRYTAFILALIAAVFLLTWIRWPSVVNDIDTHISIFYKNYYLKKFNHAMSLKRGDNKTASIKAFEYLIADMDDWGKLDILYSLKRRVYIELVNLYLQTKNIEKAYDLTENWIKHDERDIDAQLYFVQLIGTMNGKGKETIDYYHKIFSKFNNIKKVVNPYIDYLIAKGKMDKAIEVTEEYLKNTENNTFDRALFFKLYYEDLSGGFSEKNSVIVTDYEKNGDCISFSIIKKNEGFKRLRIDFEDISETNSYILSNVKMKITTPEGKYEYSVDEKNQRNDLEVINDRSSFSITGPDPYLIIAPADTSPEFTGSLKFEIELTIIKNFIPLPLQAFMNNQEWSVFYASPKTSFSEQTKKNINWSLKDNAFYSKSDFSEVNENIEKLRLDFPSIIGLSFNNAVINIYFNNDAHKTISVQNLNEQVVLKGIRKDGQKFTIQDKDPYLVLSLLKANKIKTIETLIYF